MATNPTLDQILANDLEELEAGSYTHRSRRDEEAVSDKCRPFRKKRWCCAEETFEEQHEKEKELKKECFRKIQGKDKDGPREFDPFRCDKVDKHRRDMTVFIPKTF